MPSFFVLLHALLVSFDHLLDHLAADGACLTGGQVTVVTVGQVDANLGSSLHLELVHGLTSLGDIQLVVVLVAHNRSLLFVYPESKMLSGWRASFLSVAIVLPRKREKHMFLFGKMSKFWKNQRCLRRCNLTKPLDFSVPAAYNLSE